MSAVRAARDPQDIRDACAALGLPRATWYRSQTPVLLETPGSDEQTRPSSPSPTALPPAERGLVLEQLDSERFADLAVPQVHATLLDEGTCLCSQRTMYRVLEDAGSGTRAARPAPPSRLHQARAPDARAEPALVLGHHEVEGAAKGSHYHLYVLLDVCSRCAVGWMVAERESAALASELIDETIARHGIAPGQLTIHAARGTSMTSKDVALLLADLGVTKTHSRPHVSDDNPYFEAQLKTLEHRPEFPERFGSMEDARKSRRRFFVWYNREHHNSGIAMMRPCDVHTGRVVAVLKRRAMVLEDACRRHPERFVRGALAPQSRPRPAWINPPLVLGSLQRTTAD